MAGRNSIKLFEFNQIYCHNVGIQLPKSTEDRCKLIAMHLIFVVCLAQYAIASVGFLVYDAKSMGECTAAIFMLISIINTTFVYFITISKLEEIWKFTEHCERFIEKSKWADDGDQKNPFYLFKFTIQIVLCVLIIATGDEKPFAYKELNAKIEKMCEWLWFALLATFLSIVLLSICYTCVAYYILDLGVDSFYLFPPTEFVKI